VGKDDPGDVVVAPTGDFADFAPKLAPGSAQHRPHSFWRSGQAGGAHPDISSHEKFVAFTKKAGVLAMPIPRSAA